MHLGQLLVGEGRSKIGVACLEQFECTLLGVRLELTMAGTPTLLRNQPFVTEAAIDFQQPDDLAHTQIQLLCGEPSFDSSFVEVTQDLDAATFLLAHV